MDLEQGIRPDEPSYGALGAGATLSAISVALAAVVQGYGTGGEGSKWLALLFLASGLLSLWATGVALVDIYLDIKEAKGTADRFLFFLFLGLLTTNVAYIWLIVWVTGQ